MPQMPQMPLPGASASGGWPSFRLPQGMRPSFRRGDQGSIVIPRREGELAEHPSGEAAGVPDFKSMFPDDAWQTAQQSYQGGIRQAQGMEDLRPQIQSAQGDIDQTMTSHDYDPSVLRKILGIGAAIAGGGPDAYTNITNMPREKALQPQIQKLAGLRNLEGLYERTAGTYKDAGANMSATLDSLARNDATRQQAQEANMPVFEAKEFADPAGVNRTGAFQTKGAGAGRFQQSGPPSKIDYEYRNVMQNGSPQQRLMPKSPVPGASPQNFMPVPDNTTGAYYNLTSPAQRSPQGYGSFLRSTQQPSQALEIFNAEMAAKKQSQNLDDKLEGVAWDYYRGASSGGAMTDVQTVPKAKQAVDQDPQIPADQKNTVKAKIDRIYQKLIGLTPDLERGEIFAPSAPAPTMPAPVR